MADLSHIRSDSKRDLLRLMKERGSISLADARHATGLSQTTLREHLGELNRLGLVEVTTRRAGRGRPSLRYALTPDGDHLFPTRDGVILGELLEYLRGSGHTPLVRDFMEDFWAKRLREVQAEFSKLEENDEAGRIAVLERTLTEQGFMPEISQTADGLVIREGNCPFPETVKHTRLPCKLEAQFFEKLFGERIGRVSYIPDGRPACTYEFCGKRDVARD